MAENFQFEASISEVTLHQNNSFAPFDGEIQVGLPVDQLTMPSIIRISKLVEDTMPPSGFKKPTALYQIDIPAAAFKPGRYFVSLKSSGSTAYKQIYFFDKNAGETWRPLPTNENFGKGLVSTYLTMPFVRLAVFESTTAIVKGSASWYRYKNGLFAASPDFPKGTKLRVINTTNQKSVDVIVNDYGPDRSQHPDRVIDLDAVAFARLASLGQGTMSVAIEVLPEHITSDQPAPEKGELEISAKNAVIFDSLAKKVVWQKGKDEVIPLASLTKLAAVKVFLETKPDLKKVVAYSVKDEEMNHKYVLPSESARLRLKDGETVTIKDLVYSSLIGSTNNTVETLVRVSGLKRDVFIAKMNAKAKQLGATQTRFIEPTGLSLQNVTSARDYAIIARDAFLNSIIASASVEPSYTVRTLNTKRTISFKNTNLLARNPKSDILGSKTGYLTEAGYCLVTKWPTEKRNIIIVVFGAPSRQASADDTQNLLTFAKKTLN